MARALAFLLHVAATLCVAAPAAAQDVPATTPEPAAVVPAPEPSAPAGVTFNGFVSTSYHHNFNAPASGLNTLRVFDVHEDTFSVDVFELVAQRVASAPGDIGFRADLTAGAAVPRVAAARGLFRDPETGRSQDVDLQQAFVSWVAPVGKGLRVDVGKFVSPIGYEVIEGYDGWNDNVTRAFRWYGIPFTHTGLEVTYAFSRSLSGSALLVNGWDNVLDDNDGKTVGAQLAWSPGERVTVFLNAMSGPERDGEDEGSRRLVDVVAVFKATDRLTLALNADFAREDGAFGPGEDASWTGVTAYAKLLMGDNGAVSLRGERFDDADGARTGTPQTLTAVTLTPEWRLSENSVFRFDLRFDGSDEATFEDAEGRLTDGQTTLSFNLLFSF